MTEADWNRSTDPAAMLAFLGDSGNLTERTARLFAAACCRRILPPLAEDECRQAVEVAERHAEGQVPLEPDLREACQQAIRVCHALRDKTKKLAVEAAAHAARCWDLFSRSPGQLTAQYVAGSAVEAAGVVTPESPAKEKEAQAALIRDIFGPLPFRAVSILPSVRTWQDATLVRLAQASYECRRLPAGTLEPERLAVLADAFEEAGCNGGEILAHLRSPGPHVRGCFVLDLILAKDR
jgi:hypothetical protein